MEGNPPMESGSSQNDMDYLHVINWKKAEELVKAGKFETIAGMKVLRLDVSAAEGVLTFVPEPKSPHGVDVTPTGEDIVVGGKLDTHGTVYSFAKIKALIDAKKYAGKDPYGVPILDFKESIRGQVEIGLGPLHTVFDDQGFAYTSMFIETVVAKWSLKDLKVVDKVSTHYNIGHLTAAEGDTVSPDGKYLIAMNKWALDRFNKVGPLLPQNFQLVD
jgi:nitrous-oxide reductase